MKRYETVWDGMKGYEMVWHSMKWYQMVWNGVKQFEAVWDGMKWYETVWVGMKRYETVWDGMKLYDLRWYETVWCGMRQGYKGNKILHICYFCRKNSFLTTYTKNYVIFFVIYVSSALKNVLVFWTLFWQFENSGVGKISICQI